MKTLLILYLASSLLLCALAIPLILEKIPPNPLYGFRIAATLNDDKTWYAINKHGGKGLLVTGAVTALASLLLYPLGLGMDAYALALLGIFVLVFGIAIAQTLRYLRAFTK